MLGPGFGRPSGGSTIVAFEWILVLLLGAIAASAFARRFSVPYPALLAVGGVGLALVSGVPELTLPPDLVLALFVAPILLDAAFDTSLRDLKDNWRPVTGLVVVAVGITTAAVAVVACALVPDLPWAAAVALGAIVAPPDAAAATAVLRQVRLPRRLVVVLEGESLLNDASALLLYRLAVGAFAAGGFRLADAAPALALVTLGSLAFGLAAALAFHWLNARVADAPSAVLLQFIGTFGVWIAAEHLQLSGILTIVTYGVLLGRIAPDRTPARLRVPSYAVWETATFSLSVLAFALIGFQLRPILVGVPSAELARDLLVALAVLATVILVRIPWVMAYNTVARWRIRRHGFHPPRPMLAPTFQGGVVIAWCGMRGVVTVAAALALPDGFPHRGTIVLAAFVTVLGTLLIQGCTLAPLLRWLDLHDDGQRDRELALARRGVLAAALASLEGDRSEAAEALRGEYRERLAAISAGDGGRLAESSHGEARRRAVGAARRELSALRRAGRIGDDVYHAVEEDLDWIEMSVG